MLSHAEDCADPRGEGYLKEMFDRLAAAFGCETPRQAAELFDAAVRELALPDPAPASEEDIRILKGSVNQTRLKNHPIRLSEEVIEQLYMEILKDED
jgi:hypothetical protein